MKHFKNGSVGTLSLVGGNTYSNATIVDVSKFFVEFEDSAGVRHITTADRAGSFDFVSAGTSLTPRFGPRCQLQAGAAVLDVTSIEGPFVEYEDSSGNSHVMNSFADLVIL